MFEGLYEGERKGAQFTLSEGEMELIEELGRNSKIAVFVMPVEIGDLVLKAASVLQMNPADFAQHALSTATRAVIKGGACINHLHAILTILTKDKD